MKNTKINHGKNRKHAFYRFYKFLIDYIRENNYKSIILQNIKIIFKPQMKKLIYLITLFTGVMQAQVGIGTTTPCGALDISSALPSPSTQRAGLVPPIVALSATNSTVTTTAGVSIINPTTNGLPVTGTIVYNTSTSGTSPNQVTPGYYFFNGTLWERLNSSTSGNWSLTGNAGTNPTTNFIGTTDAVDLVLKTANTERLRINNAVGTTTGTAGDISIGNSTNGTIKASRELVLRQDGDTFGSSALRLRNRSGENGAIFENLNPLSGANLVDFLFKTGPSATPISSNIRFETRSGSRKVTGNTTEWQFGQPDNTNGGPTLVVGANGTGSRSAFLIGNLGIGTGNPTGKVHVFEATGTAPAGNGVGTLVIEHGNTGGQSSIVFPSAVNKPSDFGYIRYSDDLSGNGTSTENSLLEIGVENDGVGGDQDDIAIMPSGNLGVGTRAPKAKFHNNGTTAFTISTNSANSTIVFITADFTPPAATADNNGMIYIIRNTLTTNLNVNNIIDYGVTTMGAIPLNATRGSITIVSNGTNWYRID